MRNVIRENMIEEFQTKERPWQGGLRLVLFIIFMDDIIRKYLAHTKKLSVGYKNLIKILGIENTRTQVISCKK